ncbi:Sugar/inositol transporter [Fusarium oxysporum f. sp. vasinfectum]|uniref:Major facilitator superfamily (MFS) profile domain-containing protein n=1 Tax=Fusarium oxysporum f. sp. vasinfectum 25433 TaxID=1089449 RepID=X0L2C8_FUSOX|nr:hypothetical protein FOTG_12019 [Fusarium oxysporum f. sp. vasinfectum 25433]KAK2929049.1 Sugar/inositol transporter [Fusarium oxysporum f. sp. vasinfectum]
MGTNENGGHDEVRVHDLCTKESWWNVPHLVRLNLMLAVPFMSAYIGGYDGSVLNGMQTLDHWKSEFGYPSGGILGLLVNIQTIGGVVALPVAPWMADKYGRRHPIFLGSCIIIGAAILQGCATNMAMFLAGRFFIGLGGMFISCAAPPLLGELAYPTHRPIITGIYNTTWYTGAIVAAWATYGTFHMNSNWSWRIPSLLQALVSIFQVIFVYFLPESPRWLVANGRAAEATKVLSKHHSGTDEPTELVRLQIAEITSAIEFERSVESVSYLQFFKTKGNRHRLVVVASLGFIIQWCGNQLIGPYLALVLSDIGITDGETQNLINGGLQIYNFIIACSSATLIDRIGRRPLLLTSTIGMLSTFTVWTILAARNQMEDGTHKGFGIGIVVLIFVFFTFYNIAMSPLPIAYLLEVLPYTLRSKGLSIFNLAQICSGLFNGFVNPVALKALRWKYYIVFVVAQVLWLSIIYFTYPETRGLALEEVAQVFDGRQVLDRTLDIKAEGIPEVDHKSRVTSDDKEL